MFKSKEYLTKLQADNLKFQYESIYKTIKVKFNDDGDIDNPIYGVDKVSLTGNDNNFSKQQNLFKKYTAIIELCKLNRHDFPQNWDKFINQKEIDNQKRNAKILFRSGNIQGFHDFMTCLWATNVSFVSIDNVVTNLSYKDFGDIFYSSLHREYLKTNDIVKAFSSNTFSLTSDINTIQTAYNFLQSNFQLLTDNELLIGENSKFLKNKRTRKFK